MLNVWMEIRLHRYLHWVTIHFFVLRDSFQPLEMANGKIGLACAAIAAIFGCILAMYPSGFEDGATE